MPRVSAYTKYIANKSEEEVKSLNEQVRKMYLEDNMTREEISNSLNIDFSIIRGITDKLKKSKSLKYQRIAENSARTNIERYGTKCTLNTEDSIKKKQQTWINNYGVDNPSKSKEVKDKKVRTSREHYGTDYPSQSVKVKDKIIKTNIKRYGVKHPLQSAEVKSHHIGLINQRESIPDYARSILFNKDKFESLIKTIEPDKLTIRRIAELLDYYSVTTIRRQYINFGFDKKYKIRFYRSYGEIEIANYLDSIGYTNYELNSHKPIHPYELDIYIPEFKLGIEFNGDYWHSDQQKESQYHQKKSLYAKSKGIFIYHIWEHEWNDSIKQEIIKSQIRNLLHLNKVVYARNCTIRDISSNELREFLNKNHTQGNRNSSIRYGLFYKDELVSVMSFGFNKFIRKNSDDIELLRFCNKQGISVVGGASKLFNKFIKDNNYNSVISYCDIAKGRGDLYLNLGFKLNSITPSNYKWINVNTGEVKSRYQCQMKNESEIMISNGFIRVEDCGSYKYIYRLEDS